MYNDIRYYNNVYRKYIEFFFNSVIWFEYIFCIWENNKIISNKFCFLCRENVVFEIIIVLRE